MRMAVCFVAALALAGASAISPASAEGGCGWQHTVKTDQPVNTVAVPQTPAPTKAGG